MKELDSDSSAHDEAGLDEGDGSAQQALQSEDDQSSEVSEVSQTSEGTLAPYAAKHSMACRLARLGLAVLARRQPAVHEEAEQQGKQEEEQEESTTADLYSALCAGYAQTLRHVLHTLEHKCMIA